MARRKGVYCTMNGTWKDINKELDSWSKEELKNKIINDHYNEVCNRWCDEESMPNGKALPYIGWFWRYVHFTDEIDIGDCGEFKGVMVKNKWGHPERKMTSKEKKTFIEMLDDLNNPSYIVSGEEINKQISRECKKIWDWFQELKI